MVVGVREVVRGEKERAGRQRGVARGLACQENRAEKKTTCFYSPFETALPSPPPYSLAPILLAGRGNKAER